MYENMTPEERDKVFEVEEVTNPRFDLITFSDRYSEYCGNDVLGMVSTNILSEIKRSKKAKAQVKGAIKKRYLKKNSPYYDPWYRASKLYNNLDDTEVTYQRRRFEEKMRYDLKNYEEELMDNEPVITDNSSIIGEDHATLFHMVDIISSALIADGIPEEVANNPIYKAILANAISEHKLHTVYN